MTNSCNPVINKCTDMMLYDLDTFSLRSSENNKRREQLDDHDGIFCSIDRKQIVS